MKDFLDFLKERASNRILVPFIFAFSVYNWPIFLALYKGGSHKDIYIAINEYLKAGGALSYIFPFLTALALVLITPYLSMMVVCCVSWAETKTRIANVNSDQAVKSARLKSIVLEEKISEIEGGRKSKDLAFCRELNTVIGWTMAKILFTADKNQAAPSGSAIDSINSYISLGNSSAFSNKVVQREHQALLAALSDYKATTGDWPSYNGAMAAHSAYRRYREAAERELGFVDAESAH